MFLRAGFSAAHRPSQNLWSGIPEADWILSSRKYLDRIGTEGGTGIPKICKLISVDLKKEMKIDFGFEKDQNYFFIELFIRRWKWEY